MTDPDPRFNLTDDGPQFDPGDLVMWQWSTGSAQSLATGLVISVIQIPGLVSRFHVAHVLWSHGAETWMTSFEFRNLRRFGARV